jgi:hypothetical protein
LFTQPCLVVSQKLHFFAHNVLIINNLMNLFVWKSYFFAFIFTA